MRGRLRSWLAIVAACSFRLRLLRSERAGLAIGQLLDLCARMRLPSRIVTGGALLVAQASAASGNRELALGLARSCARSAHEELAMRGHALLVDADELDVAESIVETGRGTASWSRGRRHLLAADRLLAAGEARRALDDLANAESVGEHATARTVAALVALGRPKAVLEVLATDPSALPPANAACTKFDALWALGDAAEALDVLDAALRNQVGPAAVAARYVRAARWLGVDGHAVRRLLLCAGASPDDHLSVLFDLGDLDEIVDILERRGTAPLGATGRYVAARTHYVRREFARARGLVPSLMGTARHWDGEKLESRMLLEEGRYDEALAHRASRRRLRVTFDEVEYFARLHLGRFDEAFASYLLPSDARRLTARFGDAADASPEQHVGSRVVVAQNGPGDEILLASTYPLLHDLSTELTIVGDPRLERLFLRSFPYARFVPSARTAGTSRPGFLRSGEPERDDSTLFDLLTTEAGVAGDDADSVVLGRSLPRFAPQTGPAEAYIRPDPEQVEIFRNRLGEAAVGVVWRSELSDPIRSIHYLRAGDLGPLADCADQLVCLQHDATDTERAELSRMLGDRLVFLDDVDLRDDFETIAGVVAACDAVVGAGTTTLELAAAVGTRSIALHPNVIGAWRSQDGHDYWHASMQCATANDPRRPTECVDAAAALLHTSR